MHIIGVLLPLLPSSWLGSNVLQQERRRVQDNREVVEGGVCCIWLFISARKKSELYNPVYTSGMPVGNGIKEGGGDS